MQEKLYGNMMLQQYHKYFEDASLIITVMMMCPFQHWDNLLKQRLKEESDNKWLSRIGLKQKSN